MKRTKLADRQLPVYTKAEEIINMLTHIIGIILGVVVLMMCVVKTIINDDAWGLTSGIMFGVSMVLLYTMSTLYHGWESEYQKKVLQIIDHCTIYVLIMGTFMPLCLTKFRETNPALAWTLFAIVVVAGVVGTVFTAIDLNKYKVLSMIGYLSPWFLLFMIKPLIDTYGVNLIWYLVGGGAAYSIGAIFYGLGSKGHMKYMHSVFHIFILIGSLVHFVGIYDCCLQ